MKVWQTISTKEGLETCWMVRSEIEIDLSVGGLFKHHWISTIHDIKHERHIVFDEPEGGWMRFQVEPDVGGSVFTLMVV
ncbi:MAG: hypothetical protein HOH43_06955 [Candidatus Latescibacteria bacterium]|nr:hypothetical protein [Candidatus Latescibacterota bacterium]